VTKIPDVQLPPGFRWAPLHHRSDDKYGKAPIHIQGIREIEHDVKEFPDGVSWTIKFKTHNTDWGRVEIGEYMVLENIRLFKITGRRRLPYLHPDTLDNPVEITGLAVVEHVPDAKTADRPVPEFTTGHNPALRKVSRGS